MAQINFANITRKVAASRNCERKVHKAIEPIFRRAHKEMMEEFKNHVITEELKEGPNGANISATLPEGYGNLFSFIGFNAEDDPTLDIKESLEQIEFPERARATPFIKGQYRTIGFQYKIKTPTPEELNDKTQYPDGWRDGSWLDGIEKGIPGFESYLFDEDFEAYPQSRSTTGLQAKDRGQKIIIIREGAYQPVKYISEILENFVKKLS